MKASGDVHCAQEDATQCEKMFISSKLGRALLRIVALV